VLVGGDWKLRDRVIASCDERQIHANAAAAAKKMWERMQRIS
jgi:hypothetical protein